MPADGCPRARRGGYSCRFCRVPLCRGDSGCGCSTPREKVTYYATLCHDCAAAVDELTADTRLGRVHRDLLRDAANEARGPVHDTAC